MKKGSLAGVDGRLQSRSYEGQDGKRVYVTEVVADSVQFLESRSGGEQRGSFNQQPSGFGYGDQGPQNNPFVSSGSSRPASPRNDDPFANAGQPIDISDDDLPF